MTWLTSEYNPYNNNKDLKVNGFSTISIIFDTNNFMVEIIGRKFIAKPMVDKYF